MEVLSWWLVFAPIYAAAVLQMVLHSCKTLEGGETLFRGREATRPRRRPGFALTLDDTLAFNISLHLNGGTHATRAHAPTFAHASLRVPPKPPRMPPPRSSCRPPSICSGVTTIIV